MRHKRVNGVRVYPRHNHVIGRPVGYVMSEESKAKTRAAILSKGEEYFKERGKKMWETRRRNLELKKQAEAAILRK